MSIPIAKPLVGKDEKEAVLKVLDSGMLTQGKWVEEFEKRFANYVGTKYAVATVNGTIALYLALKACGIGRGDEVITTPFSFIATATSILFSGATPVFVDVDPATFNIEPEKIEDAITEKTKAIMPVHLYGQAVEMDKIKDLSEEYHLKIIEDACQAHGATYNGKKVGSFGEAGCFSFYPTKNMTTGEGGMVTTNDQELVERLHLLRNHGQQGLYEHVTLGSNYRMTNLAAAIGIEQLKKLDIFNKKRIENAKYLSEHLSHYIKVPTILENCLHVFHQYTVQAENEAERERLMLALKKAGVGTRIYYPKAIHQYEPMKDLKRKELPIAESLAKKVFSLPVHPAVNQEDLELIVEVIKKEMRNP